MRLLLLSSLLLFIAAPSAQPIPVAWERTPGPYGGYVSGLATVPGASLAVNRDGLHRSEDGAWWSRIDTGFQGVTLHDVKAGPAGELYVLAGTLFQTDLVLRSLDAGLTWASFSEGLPAAVRDPKLAVGPDGVLYYGSAHGLYRRASGDDAWAPTTLQDEILALAVGDDGLVLASIPQPVDADSVVVRRSTDGGQTWSTVLVRPGYPGLYAPVRALAILPDGTALAGGFHEEDYWTPGLHRSEDGGQTWAMVDTWEDVYAFYVASTAGGGSVVFARNAGLYVPENGEWTKRSTDGGLTWSLWSEIPFTIHGVGLTDDGALLAATNYLGVQRSDDAGATWTDATLGLGQAYVARVTAGPDGTLYTACAPSGSKCAGLHRSTDGGQSWVRLPIGSPDGLIRAGVIALKADSQGRLFIAPRRNDGIPLLIRSLDRGETWEDASPPASALRLEGLVIDSSDVLYTCTSEAFYVSEDSGATWDRRDTRDCEENFDDYKVALTVSADGALYHGDHSGLYRSRDGARTWEALPGVLEGRGWVTAIGLAPDGPIYVGVYLDVITSGAEHRLYASHDDGASWIYAVIDLGGQSYNTFLDILAFEDRTAFAVTNDDVTFLLTTDGGATWQNDDTGLPFIGLIPYADLALDTAGRVLLGLSDRGLYWSLPPVGVEDGAPPLTSALSPPRPNPARTTAELTLSLPAPAHARVAVYDVLGRRVALLHDGVVPGGATRFHLDVTSLPPGTYFIRARGEGFDAVRLLTVVR